MDVKYLNYIIEMAEQKSITKAANNLFISQSSLSQYLAKLEKEVGTPLFVRTKNELLPTPAGEMYLDAARNVIDIQKSLYQNISTLSHRGQIRVGISSQWALTVLTDILPAFREKYPNITIKLYENKYEPLVQVLSSGRLDMALMACVDLDAFPYNYEVLREEEILFAIPSHHRFAGNFPLKRELSIDEIINTFHDESFVLSDEGSTLRTLTDRIFREHHFTPISSCDVNSNNAMQKLVSKEVGVSFIPNSYSKTMPDIDYYYINPKVFRYNVIAYRKNAHFSDIDQYFIDLVKSHPIFQ